MNIQQGRVSFKTSFDWRQPKLEPKLETRFGTIRTKRLFRFFTETESFGVSIEPKQPGEQPNSEIESIFWSFLRKFRVVSVVLVCFETVCFGSIPKQRDSMFRLNRNKQKTKRNRLIESIFWYFSENLGLFRFV